ncbi:MAG: TonB-dependent receptor, partial [Endomicrobium sp.]|nr:TonB-dependent receptor [Endomicrobium sp.]
VINIITKTAKVESPDANVGFSYGSDKTLNPYGTIQYYNDKAAVLLAASEYQTDGYRKNSDYKGTNLLFNGSIDITNKSSLSLSANSYDADFGYPGSKIWLDLGRRKDHNEYIKADYNLNFDEIKFKLSVYHSDNSTYNDSQFDHSKTFNKTEGIQGDLLWKSFLFGTEFVNESHNTQNTVDGIASGNLIVDKTRNTTAVYAQWDGILGKFRIIPSIRYDYNSMYYGIFTPSISAVYNLSNHFKFSANSGKVWRAPSFNELYNQWGSGNPNLKAEEGFSGDIGIEFTYNKINTFATGYYIDSDNLIVADGSNNNILKNIDKAKQYGVEIGVGYVISKWLNINLNYTYLNAENTSKGSNGKILVYSPENTINSIVNIKPLDNLLLSAVVSYKDKYFENERNTIENNGFATLDLTANYKVNNMLSFWIKGFNIANADYQIVDGYPMPGTTVYAGIDFKFWK